MLFLSSTHKIIVILELMTLKPYLYFPADPCTENCFKLIESFHVKRRHIIRYILSKPLQILCDFFYYAIYGKRKKKRKFSGQKNVG